ncbi:FeoA family protein [Gracilinema caldarium]|uniref:FeoA family protein n=1 Tax=Gracilinema caldarium (strain ATCC 51460 / DSM 7334 / H1) TaxID=744872 RepID=F8EWZ5_GRAC1|nr:FeoA family protein [Gracilinema caldarium]AEJ18522.1 FeoA family protein [Gracilinema caldarium DSM 7334]
MYLSDAPNGASFRVLRVTIGKEVGKRLVDMGFTEGAEGAVVRGGMFRGPLQVRIRGYDVLIRRTEAAGIEVEPVGDWTAAEDAHRYFGHFNRFGRGRGFSGRGRHGRFGFGQGDCEDSDGKVKRFRTERSNEPADENQDTTNMRG